MPLGSDPSLSHKQECPPFRFNKPRRANSFGSDERWLRAYDAGMVENSYLREVKALYREASDPAHDVFNDDTSDERWDRFHAVSKLGLRFLDGHNLDGQKSEEINRLLLFAMNFPGFPDGQIYADENPDFKIILPHREIGIELRDVYVEVPGQPARLFDAGNESQLFAGPRAAELAGDED